MKVDTSQCQSFLSKVAKDLCQKKNQEVENLCLIFTNRRAIRFFSEEYAKEQEEFYWLPNCKTISDFVEEHSLYRLAQELSLIYVLYQSYKRIYYSYNPLAQGEQEETFESFYFWGKTILNDFDDIDKNLANAEKLYITLSEEKEIEALFDFLDPEQKDILSKYFDNFRKLYSTDSTLQHNFVSIWNCLLEIYNDYRKSLSALGIAYSGMMYRDLLERIEAKEICFEQEKFAFVGFNVLNKVERELFKAIRLSSSASFYWDYDTYYTEEKNREAGLFMRENLKDFPHNETFAQNNFSQIQSSDCHIEILSSAYETSQVFYIKQWVKGLELQYGESLQQNSLAIILQNEELLPFVLKSLPEQIAGFPTKVNITMGYPFKFSKLYSDMSSYLKEQSDKSIGIMEQLEGLIEFVKAEGKAENCENETKEAAYRTIVSLEDLKKTLGEIPQELPENFIHRTILRLLQRQTMPFESDATDGVQVMGLLESRNLDFMHILMLSCTNTLLPSIGNSLTFIPHSLRQIFDLTTTERKVAVFAYYFYRLLHNAKSIHYLYNTSSSSKDSEEMSCFLQQLRVELERKITCKTMSLSQTGDLLHKPLPDKCQEDLAKLLLSKSESDNEHSYLSPTFLTDYIDCPLLFYYKRILGLQAPKDTEDKLPLAFGTLFHNSAQIMEEKGRAVSVVDCIEEALKTLKEEEQVIILQIHKDTIAKYLDGLRFYDNKDPERYFQEAEKEVVKQITIEGKPLRFGGKIDRIDHKGDRLILCDYKTGGNDEEYKGIESLFKPEKTERAKYLYQIMFYAWLLWNGEPIEVEILYIHKLLSKEYNPTTYLYDAQTHKEFDQKIKEYIKELFNTTEIGKWQCNSGKKLCDYCDYAELCPQKTQETNDRI